MVTGKADIDYAPVGMLLHSPVKDHSTKLTPRPQVLFPFLVTYTPSARIPGSLYDPAIKYLIPALQTSETPLQDSGQVRSILIGLMPLKYF